MNRRGVLLSAVSLAAVTTAEAVTPGRLLTVLTGKRAAVNPYTPTYSTDFTTATSLPAWLTHTRGSLAMMTDANGYLTYCPNNLLTYSNTFSNGAWTGSNVAATDNAAVSPSGASNAASLITANGQNYVSRNASFMAVVGTNYIIAVNACSYGFTSFNLRASASDNTRRAEFNLSTGTVTSSGAGLVSSGITSLGNGWYRCWVVISAADATTAVAIFPGTWGQVGNGTNGIYVYLATASAVTYETSPRPQDQVITTSAAYYGPRLNASGLLIEEARTNYCLYSDDFSNAAWQQVNTATKTANYAVGPNGLQTAARLQLGAASQGNNVLQQNCANGTWSSQTNTLGFWVKSNTGTNQTFALKLTQAGVADHFSSDMTATTTWQRFSFAQAFAAGGAGYWFGITNGSGGAAADILVACADLWQNASFDTSHIPTTTTAVTRAADIVQIVGAGLGVLQGAQWSIIGDMQPANYATYYRLIGSASGGGILALRNTGTAFFENKTGSYGVTTGNTTSFGITARLGGSVSSAGSSVALNGGTVVSQSGNTGFGNVTLYLGSDSGSSSFVNGYVSKLALYNARLPDATLQAKTVLGAAL